MAFDPLAIFANLTEKERLYGHHSAEGQALRLLSRALDGWSTGNLSARDVLVLCDQAIEDWLEARTNKSAWSAARSSQLLDTALASELITAVEFVQLQRLHDWRVQSTAIAVSDVETALKCTVEIIERHWS